MNLPNLFNFFKSKTTQTVQYVSNWQYGKPVWSTQYDKQYIEEAYNKVVWVYSCVAMISSCVSSVPWNLYRVGRGGKSVEIEDHPILNMLNVKVNPNLSSRDFFDLWATYLACQGKFYGQFNSPTLPTEIRHMYPHYVRVIPDKQNFVKGYEYTINGVPDTYKANEIMWSKFNDPLNAYDGLSPIRALARTIDTENEAVDWNKTTLQNSAVPPGAIQVVNPSPELQEKLRDDWIKRYGGSKNARVPLVLNAEKASYVNFGLNPVDMDFLNQRKMNRIEICTAFGVPGQVVGDPEGQTYANYSEALKAFWENTVIPRYLDHMKQVLNMNIAARYADNLRIKYNLDGIQALHESVDAIAERVRNLWKDGVVTRNEARFELGYTELDREKGEVFYQDMATQFFAQQNEEKNSEDNKDDKKKESKALNMSEEQKEKFWEKTEDERQPYYENAEKIVRERFEEEKTYILSLVKKKINVMVEVENGLNGAVDNWKRTIINIYVPVIEHFSGTVFNELQVQKMQKKEFDIWTNEVLAWVSTEAAKKAFMIKETTLGMLRKIITDGIAYGESIRTIAENIDKLYLDQIISNRSTIIARTEVVSASNKGSIESAKQADVEVKKVWIPTFDQRTRDSHLAMGSKSPIDLDSRFSVNGYSAEYPGDSNLPASECINCRCTIGYVRK